MSFVYPFKKNLDAKSSYYVVLDHNYPMRFAFDDGGVQELWYTANGNYLGINFSNSVREMANEMMNAMHLHIQARTEDGITEDLHIDLRGARTAIPRFFEDCEKLKKYQN